MISYTVIRSSRKTIAMQIGKDGSIIVRAPKKCSRAYIEEFVRKHESWAEKNQARMRQIISARSEYRLREGTQLPFCGETLTVEFHDEETVTLKRETRTITVPDRPVPALRPLVYGAYKKAGRQYLQGRLDHWANVMGITYGKMRIGSAVRRWGSCSRDGNINLSWLLFFASEDVVDYLIVHELSHRVHFDHSSAFWGLVARYMPDYKQRKKKLNEIYQTLLAQGWAAK